MRGTGGLTLSAGWSDCNGFSLHWRSGHSEKEGASWCKLWAEVAALLKKVVQKQM
jgi:hypothetical protein